MLKFIAGVVVGVVVSTTSPNSEMRRQYTKGVRYVAKFLTLYAEELTSDLKTKKENNR